MPNGTISVVFVKVDKIGGQQDLVYNVDAVELQIFHDELFVVAQVMLIA